MKKVFKATLVASFFVVLFYGTAVPQTSAADITSVGIANYLPIQAERVEDGNIVVVTQDGYFLSKVPYDSQAIGVVSTKPAISLKTTSEKGTYPVVNFGNVTVKVSGTNGNIKRGDAIATSSLPGVGMKATQTGYVVGDALLDVTFANKNDVKTIPMALNIHFYQSDTQANNSILDLLSMGRVAGYQQPFRVLQYIIAGIIVIASFLFGFLIFGKTISTGIEALGRNPLAGRMIQLSIIFNVVLIIIIIMSGITLSYILIRL